MHSSPKKCNPQVAQSGTTATPSSRVSIPSSVLPLTVTVVATGRWGKPAKRRSRASRYTRRSAGSPQPRSSPGRLEQLEQVGPHLRDVAGAEGDHQVPPPQSGGQRRGGVGALLDVGHVPVAVAADRLGEHLSGDPGDGLLAGGADAQ